MAELLLIGSVDDAAAPATANAKAYVKSDSYGAQAGTPAVGLVETPDTAPAGRLARISARQVTVVIGHQSACTIVVTPIIDLNEELEGVAVALPARTEYTREPVLCRFARVLTYIRVRIQVMVADGEVEIFTPDLAGSVDHGASLNAVGANL